MNGGQFAYNRSAIWAKVHHVMIFLFFLLLEKILLYTLDMNKTGRHGKVFMCVDSLVSTLPLLSIFSRNPEKKPIELEFFSTAGRALVSSASTSSKTPLKPCFVFFLPLRRALLNTAPVKADTQEEKAKWKWKQQASKNSVPHIHERNNSTQLWHW